MAFSTLLEKPIFKFFVVGAISTSTHTTVYLLFINILNIASQPSNFFGFILAFIISFYGQRYWTFSKKTITDEIQTKIRFFASSLLSLCLNALWIYVTVNILGLQPSYAALGIILVTPFIIFLTLKIWVFV